MNRKTKKNGSTFLIRDDLAPAIDGMESSNWSTHISKNGVKTVTVTFQAYRPATTVCAK